MGRSSVKALIRSIGGVLRRRGVLLLPAVALMAAVMAWAPAMGAPAKGKAQTPQEKAVEKELKKEQKGKLPSCYLCKNIPLIEKEIKDNEAARDLYKKAAEHWTKEMEDTINAIGRYPDSRRESDVDSYINGQSNREESFKQETKSKGVVSMATNVLTCESDVLAKQDPKAERARKQKVAQFKKATKCCQLFEWSVEHELNHVKACEARNRDHIKPTAALLAKEDADEHQKQIDKLNDLLKRAKDNCENKKPTMQKYDENCEGSMRARVEDATERLSRVAEAAKQSKKPGTRGK